MSIQSTIAAKATQYLTLVTLVAFSIWILTTHEPTTLLPNIRLWLAPSAEALTQWTGTKILGWQADFIYQLSSDSSGLYLHWVHCWVLGLLLGAVVYLVIRNKIETAKLYYLLTVLLSYYLAFQLLLYGFNKVFKCQFFLPEPNTLYTTVGDTPRDLLFWSVMGSSYGYTVFGGVLEVIAGLLLLFGRTRLLGGLLSLGILTNVVAINLGFHISVKLYSSVYWLAAFLIVLPHGKRLFAFLIQNKWLNLPTWRPIWISRKAKIVAALCKAVIIWLLLMECLLPYAKSQNYNDDLAARPAFHGAYSVQSYLQDELPIPALPTFDKRWDKAFVHRRGYWIVQYMDGSMQDFHFRCDEQQQLFELIHTSTQVATVLQYQLHQDSSLTITGMHEGKEIEVYLQKLDWERLPLLQQEFDWTIDALQK